MEKSLIEIDLPDESKILETDGWISKSKTLIEAKASLPVSRWILGWRSDNYLTTKDIRKPDHLAILLPACPTQDLVNLIFSQNIEIL